MRKRPPDDSVDSDCSADDVLSDDPSLVPMPGVTSGPKKPAAKKAARLLGVYGVHLSPPLPIGGIEAGLGLKGSQLITVKINGSLKFRNVLSFLGLPSI